MTPTTPPVIAIITVETKGSTKVEVKFMILLVPYMVRLKANPIIRPMIAPAFKPSENVVILAQFPKMYTSK